MGLLLLPRLLGDHAEVGLDHVAVLAADRFALRFHEVAGEARWELAPVAGLEQHVRRQVAFGHRAGLDGRALALAGHVGHRVLAGHLALAGRAALPHRLRLGLRRGGHRLARFALTLALFRLALALTLLGLALTLALLRLTLLTLLALLALGHLRLPLAVERVERLGEELGGRVGERAAFGRALGLAFGLALLLAARLRELLGVGLDGGLSGLV